MNVPIPISINSQTSKSGLCFRHCLSPHSVSISAELVTIGICAGQKVKVEVIQIMLALSLQQLSDKVGGHGRSYPLTCMNT